MTTTSIDGFLIVDKPAGMTSRDAVNRIQRQLPRKTRIGHTGTLDPLATGVLVLCIGRATKLADTVQAMGKVYRTAIRLGATSTTDDADGEVRERDGGLEVTEQRILSLLPQFVGVVQQVPPAFSALKVQGRRAYDKARRGEEVVLNPRSVRIDRIDLLSYRWPDLVLEIACGKGTYIRSIARDLGQALGCGGYVRELRRFCVGPFEAERAVGVDADRAMVLSHLIPIATLDQGSSIPDHGIAPE
jgi:tRNA pseudouridine55 synthase